MLGGLLIQQAEEEEEERQSRLLAPVTTPRVAVEMKNNSDAPHEGLVFVNNTPNEAASHEGLTTQFDIFPPERVQLHQESGNIFSKISSEGNRTADLRACFFTIYAVTLLTFIIQEEI